LVAAVQVVVVAAVDQVRQLLELLIQVVAVAVAEFKTAVFVVLVLVVVQVLLLLDTLRLKGDHHAS
jgi:hypothetical protein